MFSKKSEPNCSYCKFGYVLYNGTDCICEKKGMISLKTDCSKFVYEPLKRVPPKPPVLDEYKKNDFTIN